MRKDAGVTLVELIVAVAIIAILAGFTVPAFTNTIRNNRLAAASNTLLASLQFARSEAIKRGIRVTLCKSADGSLCSKDGGYEQGWLVFEDRNGNAQVDGGETIIRVMEGQAMSISGNTPVRHYISYMPEGWTRLKNGGLQMGTLTLCEGQVARRVIISRSGRARTKPGSC